MTVVIFISALTTVGSFTFKPFNLERKRYESKDEKD